MLYYNEKIFGSDFLNFSDAAKRAEELRKILKYHSDLYYNKDNPEIDDYEYDMLNNELKSIEKEYSPA